jgi:hypothetical protein
MACPHPGNTDAVEPVKYPGIARYYAVFLDRDPFPDEAGRLCERLGAPIFPGELDGIFFQPERRDIKMYSSAGKVSCKARQIVIRYPAA